MRKCLFLILAVIFIQNCYSSDYYWVGNSGNWSEYSTHWATSSGGIEFHLNAPTANDNVIFDENSFTLADQTVTLNQTVLLCNNMDWSSVTNNPIFYCDENCELKIFGSLSLGVNMTMDFNGACRFLSNSSGNTITTCAHPLHCNMIFSGEGGEWILQDTLYAPSERFELEAGTFRANGNYMTCAIILDDVYSERTFDISNSTIDCSYWYGDFSYNGLSVITENSTINIVSYTGTFYGGDLSYKILNYIHPTSYAHIRGDGTYFEKIIFNGYGAIEVSNLVLDTLYCEGEGYLFGNNCTFGEVEMNNIGVINGNNSFENLTLNTGYTYTLEANKTQTILNNLIIHSETDNNVEIVSSVSGTQANIYKPSGTICGEHLSLMDINAYGGALFYAGEGSSDAYNNTGWIFDNTMPCSALSFETLNIEECDNYISPSGVILDTSGIYMDAIPNTSGYDSVLTINLSIINPDISITLTDTSLISNAINADYQWIDCETMLPIEGEISQTLYPSFSGNYAVEITEEGCVDISDCYYIETLDIAKYDISTHIKLYPNPTKGVINLELDKDFKDYYIVVRNVLGEDILKKHYSSSLVQFEITGEKGMYFIEISSDKYRQNIKVIKN